MKDFLGNFLLKSISETEKHAKLTAQKIKAPCLILLQGDLGTGKTTWVRFFLQAYLKNKKLIVSSPSYSLMNRYEKGSRKATHMDLYRLKNLDDLESTGFWDLLNTRQVVCVEWSEMLPRKELMEFSQLVLQLSHIGENKRGLTCFRQDGLKSQ